LLVRDIGRQEDGKCKGLFGLGTGTVTECNQDDIILFLNHILLNNCRMIFNDFMDVILNILWQMLSGPGVVFFSSWRTDQWRSMAKCGPGPTIKVPHFQSLKFTYKNFKLKNIMFSAYLNI